MPYLTRQRAGELEARISYLESAIQRLQTKCSNLEAQNKRLQNENTISNSDTSVRSSTISRKSSEASPNNPSCNDSWSSVVKSKGQQSKKFLTPTAPPQSQPPSSISSTPKIPSIQSQVPTSNRFDCLSEQELEAKVVVLGDSNISRVKPFVLQKSDNMRRTKVLSKHGASLEECAAQACAELRQTPEAQPLKIIFHAGTNDVVRNRTPEMLQKVRNIIRQLKDIRQGCSISFCTLPPRVDKGHIIFARIHCFNECLLDVCREEGASIIPLHQHLRRDNNVLHLDGLHYNLTGSKIVGSAISTSCNYFLKNTDLHNNLT